MTTNLSHLSERPVALVTGGARRIGAYLVNTLHAAGWRVLIHYQHSEVEARCLYEQLNERQAGSTAIYQADFNDVEAVEQCARQAAKLFGRLDVIVNNASSFFPTPVGTTTYQQWQVLFNSNAMAPYFLVQAALPDLQATQGQVINIADIYAQRPLKAFPVYCAAKAALVMLTKALARELGPVIRVNAIAPGMSLPPQQLASEMYQPLIERAVLQRLTSVEDIAQTVLFLLRQTSMTGEVIHLDCGRLLK